VSSWLLRAAGRIALLFVIVVGGTAAVISIAMCPRTSGEPVKVKDHKRQGRPVRAAPAAPVNVGIRRAVAALSGREDRRDHGMAHVAH
jgi:hypothetical protein